jgi:hypothetical protein
MKMKQTIAILTGLLVSMNLFAQGLVVFRNVAGSAVIDGQTGSPAAAGVYLAGLYWDSATSPDGFELAVKDTTTDLATTPVLGSFGGGIYSGGNIAIAGAPGGTSVLLQVRAWSAAFATYEAAAADPSAWIGESNEMTVALAGPSDPVPSISTIVQGFTTYPVPEPSTIVLGLLGGLGAMVLLRRRK